MNNTSKKNLKFVGANARQSVLDIINPIKGENLPIILFAHGFKGYKDWGHFPLVAEELASAGFCVVKFNFSHNGGTVNNPIDFPDLEAFSNNRYSYEVEDIGCVLKWIVAHKALHFSESNLNRMFLIGHSRGGGIGFLAAEKFTKIKKLVTWAAVADFKERLPTDKELQTWHTKELRFIKNGRTNQNMPMKYSFVEDLLENKFKLSIKRAVTKMQKPILVIHGKEDETVSFSDAEKICNWNVKAKLKLLENGNHTFGGKHPWTERELPDSMKEALTETIQFLKS